MFLVSLPEGAYAKLATMCHAKGIKAFKYRPKYHLSMHIVEDLKLHHFNPANGAVWMDEDYIGRVSRVSRTCHPLLQATRCIQKCLGLYCEQLRHL